MALDPAARPETARAFGDELRAWLDGRAERARRHKEAERLAAEGMEAAARYARVTGEVREAGAAADEALAKSHFASDGASSDVWARVACTEPSP